MIDGLNYRVARIDFINDPAPAGLPASFVGMGFITARQDGTGRTCSLLVDHDYALMALTAQQGEMGDAVMLADTALRFLRLGWPDEWGDDLDPTWIPVYPAGGAA